MSLRPAEVQTNNKASDTTAQGGSQEAADAADSTGDDTAGTADLMEKYASIQDFLDAPSVQEEMISQIRSALPEDSGMSMEVLAEDNKLVYSIIVEDSSLAKQMTKDPDEMESGFDSMAAGLESVASTLSDAISVTDRPWFCAMSQPTEPRSPPGSIPLSKHKKHPERRTILRPDIFLLFFTFSFIGGSFRPPGSRCTSFLFSFP